MTPELLRSKLQEKGFTDVQVSEEKPTGFPLTGEGDYYVAVSWNKEEKPAGFPLTGEGDYYVAVKVG